MVFQVPVVRRHFNSQKDLEVSYADVHHRYQNPFWGACPDPVIIYYISLITAIKGR